MSDPNWWNAAPGELWGDRFDLDSPEDDELDETGDDELWANYPDEDGGLRTMRDEAEYRCDLFKERVGYKGQEYEHSCFDSDQDRRRVIGWSNTKDDPAFMAMVEHRPGWTEYQCVQLKTGD